jgi:acetate kinase
MGTRSGDIDPSLITFLAAREQTDAGTVEGWLNTRSGLLGLSGHSADMRDLLQSARQGDGDSALAVELFCYRAKKYVGAYLAALDGAEAVVFGGGIGENMPEIRAGICRDMDWCGLHVDDSLNQSAAGREACISPKDSRIQAWVVPVNEAVIIARDTLACLARTGVPN